MNQKLLLLSLGSNVGDRQFNLLRAVELLDQKVGNWLASSPVYETEPFQVQHHTNFFNQIVAFESNLDPILILKITQKIEFELGRVSKRDMKPRTLDIDLIAYGNLIFKTRALTLPHPAMNERQFVLVPLADVVPHWNSVNRNLK